MIGARVVVQFSLTHIMSAAQWNEKVRWRESGAEYSAPLLSESRLESKGGRSGLMSTLNKLEKVELGIEI